MRMPATKRLVLDALRGGWAWQGVTFQKRVEFRPGGEIMLRTKKRQSTFYFHVTELTSNPLVWRAVAQHRKWESLTSSYYDTHAGKERQHLFIDMLWEGKTIEEALKELEK